MFVHHEERPGNNRIRQYWQQNQQESCREYNQRGVTQSLPRVTHVLSHVVYILCQLTRLQNASTGLCVYYNTKFYKLRGCLSL